MIIKQQNENEDEDVYNASFSKEELETIMHQLMDSNINDGPVLDRNVNSIDMVDKMVEVLKRKE